MGIKGVRHRTSCKPPALKLVIFLLPLPSARVIGLSHHAAVQCLFTLWGRLDYFPKQLQQ